MKRVAVSVILAVLFLALSFSVRTMAFSLEPTDANIFVDLAKKIVPSVVNISTTATIKSPYGRGGDDLFRKFFEEFFNRHGGGGRNFGEGEEDEGPPPGQRAPKAISLGTGFIIDETGLILTNNHVVADAEKIEVKFTEDTSEVPSSGEVVGRDPELDLALIKVKSKQNLKPVILGDSDKLQVGEYVIAVGNPFGQGHSVTHGIISARDRKVPDFVFAKYLQTDAPINPGNSGGPLVNLKGEVIGINNAIDARAQGIGFAIPISSVKAVLPQLKTKGTVARGYIGVLVNELTPEIAGKIGAKKDLKAAFIAHVYPGQPADQAGLKPYDVILELNGKKIANGYDLIQAVTAIPVGESASIKILRGGKEKDLKIKINERPNGENGLKNSPNSNGKEGQPKSKKDRKPVDTGMSLENITPDIAEELNLPKNTAGVIVGSLSYGGPAEQAGLLRGDIILEVDQKGVKSIEDFYSIVKDKKSYLLRVKRMGSDGQPAFVVIVLDLKTQSHQ